ncbi:uncharacterized protein LOC105775506 [Gossypium raimondii]|uniref:uncharacterized protein LOC105775506 n=1 Tax=Gossypium raimondii TaxID=29730 RepID=UPI00227D1FA6|nr:uncharacterized protein LOC105775506 [Gossypium raimondii]
MQKYTLPEVLIDNGSALNVLLLSTLNRLPVDSSHMKTCQNIVRAFDGIERRVMGRIEIPLMIDPTTYEVDFLVMDIKPSYNCLLGRPWIHSARVVPSSLHQKVKLVSESRLVTISAEEDIIATVTSDAPYVETNDEAVECSFRSLEFLNATFIAEGNKILDMPRLSTSIVVHRLPIKEDCKLVQQKLRRMRPDIVLKIKEEVKKQFDVGFLQEVKYSEWVANIVLVPKKDGKVRMCVDYRVLNKASPKDNFLLPHIDTLVDNTLTEKYDPVFRLLKKHNPVE